MTCLIEIVVEKPYIYIRKIFFPATNTLSDKEFNFITRPGKKQ